MADTENLFDPLFDDILPEETFPTARPLLAHYTSITTLEGIMRNNEFWFSNPLLMNDSEEVSFGMREGISAFLTSDAIEQACGTKDRYDILIGHFKHCASTFGKEHLKDVYVFCFSEHSRDNDDGILSMWRGYGQNGNGAAIVIDTAELDVTEESPFVISKVIYASSAQRVHWIQKNFSNSLKF